MKDIAEYIDSKIVTVQWLIKGLAWKEGIKTGAF